MKNLTKTKNSVKIFSLVLVLALVSIAGCTKKESTKADSSLEDLKGRGVFVLGLDDSFPPLGFRNEQNEIDGYDIDLAKEVATRLGVEFKAQPIDWSAKEMELATGKIDCIWNGFTMTEEREKALSFTKPYLANEQVLVVRSDLGVTKLSDMAGKKIAVQSGSSAQEAVNGNKVFSSSLKEIVLLK
ncbi:MAG: transporter substrate-binding domain-containing protein, partial [Treponema sp.]|nr:transporter substrate-binding domain-containing protein [Treponema sp.]